MMLAAVNVEALVIFAVVLGITMAITYWASKRTHSAIEFWAAGRGITGPQNGFAIAGDYMSAASFLGIAGLIFLYGYDGFLYSVGFLVAFLTVLFLLAERMRNPGSSRSPTCWPSGCGTALVGINYNLAIILTGAFMLVYVIFGGMIATTWVQIVKAVLLMTGATVMSVFVLERVGFDPFELFRRARAESPEGNAYLSPGLFLTSPIDTLSLGLGSCSAQPASRTS